MMTTRKLLVAYDESRPDAGKGDFLAVVLEGNAPVFLGLRSKRTHKLGRMVFLGRDITDKDVFAKLVDAGRKIPSVDQTLRTLAAYVQQVGNFKIGNILTVVAKSGEPGFELVLVSEMPKTEVVKLP